MKGKRRMQVVGTIFLIVVISSGLVQAATPQLQTTAPVIYLADNLDEKDQLGWCIDTIGRGFSDRLHAHSCKPQGGDVQFFYNEDKGHIASAEFKGKCMSLSDPASEKIPFRLLDCSADPSQKFSYSAKTMQIMPERDPSKCVAVAELSRTAGPFMSRDLKLSSCNGTNKAFVQWKMKSKDTKN